MSEARSSQLHYVKWGESLLELPGLTTEGTGHTHDYGLACGPGARDLLIGRSSLSRHLFEKVTLFGPSRLNWLIEGESGAGKEMIAKGVHWHSPRCHGPFLALNCAALAQTLVSSELFGYTEGSFTGATGNVLGFFEKLDGGTGHLDEIGDMSLDSQEAILRTVQFGEVKKVGSPEPIRVDVRIVASTNRSLDLAVQAGTFRRDLFNRLNGVRAFVPPLRSRPEDIVPLSKLFVALYNQSPITPRRIREISHGGLALLQAHDWSGNCHELKNVLEGSFYVGNGDVLTEEDLQHAMDAGRPLVSDALRSYTQPVAYGHDLHRSIDQKAREVLRYVRQEQPVTAAMCAKHFGQTERTWQRRLKRLREQGHLHLHRQRNAWLYSCTS